MCSRRQRSSQNTAPELHHKSQQQRTMRQPQSKVFIAVLADRCTICCAVLRLNSSLCWMGFLLFILIVSMLQKKRWNQLSFHFINDTFIFIIKWMPIRLVLLSEPFRFFPISAPVRKQAHLRWHSSWNNTWIKIAFSAKTAIGQIIVVRRSQISHNLIFFF